MVMMVMKAEYLPPRLGRIPGTEPFPGKEGPCSPTCRPPPGGIIVAETCAVISATSRSLRADSCSKCSHERLLSPWGGFRYIPFYG